MIKTVLLVQLFAFALSVEVRRDDKWPPPSIIKWFTPFTQTCRPKTGVTEEAITQFDSGEIHDDAALKCYMFCIFEEAGMIDYRGEISFAKLLDHVDEHFDMEATEIAFNMGRKCMGAIGDNMCEKAFNYHKCFKTQDPKHYFLF